MKLPKAYPGVFCMIYLQTILLFSLNRIWFLHIPIASAQTNETDRLTLLKLKESVTSDPYQVLSMWNDSNHFCNWIGVTCSSRHQRVTGIKLQGYKLFGLMSPHIGNLSFLRFIYLDNNRFYGHIPEELGHLFRLQDLVLANNTFTGSIPTSLANCSGLKVIDLQSNEITGNILSEFGSLVKLETLFMNKNNLTGGLPSSLGNISSLEWFSVDYNNLKGNIPIDIGSLKNLFGFYAGENELSGVIPSTLYNVSSLREIVLTSNRLSGTLPGDIGLTLPNISTLNLGNNDLSGTIPVTLSNMSGLQSLELAMNNFMGQVPTSLGNLQELGRLNLGLNNLGSNSSNDFDFLNFLTNCSKLEGIGLASNNFGGVIPQIVGNLSTQLQQFCLKNNKIRGAIPKEIGNLINLFLLSVSGNLLTGSIPASLGNLQNIQLLSLARNKLFGPIPTSLGNLTRLDELSLSNNKLEGSIPLSVGNCQNLQYLDLSHNNLNGTIPSQVIRLSSLSILLNLSHNSFSGSLPVEMGELININSLDFSKNNLSGEIPKTIGHCLILEYIYLQGNTFQGDIPTTFSLLKGIHVIDLSQNNLTGEIPKDLQNLPFVEYMNFSFNILEGEVPSGGLFSNASALSVTGNKLLCGGVPELNLPPCLVKKANAKENHTLKLVFIIICVAIFFILLVAFLISYLMRKSKQSSSLAFSTIVEHLEKVSYTNLHQATCGFSPNNLIGVGAFGSVYKGIFGPEERAVAVKVFNLQKKQATKGFIVECNALKNIRHRNLAKIITCCSSTDHKGGDFKALVFEFMVNGSLEKWLHQVKEDSQSLNLLQRLNIAIDVAYAIHYLHTECEQSIVHCDLKPSNILLDIDMIAHVSDFGIARLLSTTNQVRRNQSSTIGLKGTIGYAAPEYGMGGEPSKEGDMYSFGILLLEMFSGKCPTHEMFKDESNLHNYVKIAMPPNLVHIVDPIFLKSEEGQATQDICDNYCVDAKVHECLVSVFHVGLACSMDSPKERMNIRDATRELHLTKDILLGVRNLRNMPGPAN